MRSYKTEGFVIKRTSLGDADRILTIFTNHHGKIQVKAKGVRKISSKRGGHVELLNYSVFSLYHSGHMPILTEAQIIHSFPNIKKDLSRIGSAFYMCELVNGLCADHQENKNIFNLVKETLTKLEVRSDDQLIYEFEKEILSLLGFWPRHKALQADMVRPVIEGILEKKLRTPKFLPLLNSL